MKKAETVKAGGDGKDGRKAALGQALKANLARRKAQTRARKADNGKKTEQ